MDLLTLIAAIIDHFPHTKNEVGKPLKQLEADRRKVVAESSGRKIGYARVSTDEQNLALQLDALAAHGCAPVFQDTASGATANRKGLADAIACCAAGDVLTVWKLDRLGRSLADLAMLAETLKARGAGLHVLTGTGASMDTSKAEGRLLFGVLASVAEFERELIRERTTAGIRAARHRGAKFGRPTKLTPDQLDMAAKLRLAGNSWREVAKAFGVSTSTLRAGLGRRAAELQARLQRQSGTPLETYLVALGHVGETRGAS